MDETIVTFLLVAFGMIVAWCFGYSTGKTKGFWEGFYFKRGSNKDEEV